MCAGETEREGMGQQEGVQGKVRGETIRKRRQRDPERQGSRGQSKGTVEGGGEDRSKTTE